MRRRARVALALPFLVLAATTANAQKELTAHADPPAGGPAWLAADRAPASRLIGEAVSSTFPWDRLATLTDTIGNRLSGTAALDRAIQWAVAEMTRDGLENVHTQRVMVPKWLRGAGTAEVVEPLRHQSAMLGLGDSIAPPADGVQADVLVVHSFEELDAKA